MRLTRENNGRAISRSTVIIDVDHVGKKSNFDFEGHTMSKESFRYVKPLQQGIAFKVIFGIDF